MASTEFTLPQRYHIDRSSPVRWITGHALRHWPILIIALIGAFGNAAIAAWILILVGQALNALLAVPAQMNVVWHICLLIVTIALSRGVLQFMRNFGFEWIAQK